jgi:hypothetical protein
MRTLNRILDLPNVLRRNCSLTVAHAFVRTHATDRYIVSFPRSGSTWLRTILAGLIDPVAGHEPEVFNRILPGVSGRRLPLIWSLADPRIIHSHTTFRSSIPKAVYVVRDGRDAIVSYYHYLTTRNGVEMPFEDWFDLYTRRWYGPRWHDHVESWLTKGKQKLGAALMVPKLEDLKTDPVRHVGRVADFLGLNPNHSAIHHAVEKASLDQARKREAKVFGNLPNENQSSYPGGRTGQYQDYLQGDMYDRFMRISECALTLAGYKK